MGTTTKPEPTVGRNRARASDPDMELDEEREQQYDLLTAALIGAAVGARITLLLRRGASWGRPGGPFFCYAGSGAALAGLAGHEGGRGGRKQGGPGARRGGGPAGGRGRW